VLHRSEADVFQIWIVGG